MYCDCTVYICIYIYDIQVYLFIDGIYITIKYTPRRSWKPNTTLDSSSLVQQNEGWMRVFVAQPWVRKKWHGLIPKQHETTTTSASDSASHFDLYSHWWRLLHIYMRTIYNIYIFFTRGSFAFLLHTWYFYIIFRFFSSPPHDVPGMPPHLVPRSWDMGSLKSLG